MGKVTLLALCLAAGHTLGFRDARAHQEDVVHRLVDRVRDSMGNRDANSVDSMMDRVEGKK